MPLVAFVDESARHRPDDACVYALGAGLVDPGDVAQCRAVMEGLRVGKSPVVHWRLERAQRRPVITDTLAGLPLRGVAAVSTYAYDTRAERARRHCLIRLLVELEARGVDRVVLESRGRALDAKDRSVLTDLRRFGAVSHDLKVGWQASASEPMLWVADCLVGAVTWWFSGQGEYLERLGDLVTLIEAPEKA